MLKIGIYVALALLVSTFWPDLLAQVQQEPMPIPPVPVTQAVTGWHDVFRLYVAPALGALLMGIVAIILEKIRKSVLKTGATVLVAAANAHNAEVAAAAGSKLLAEEAAKHWSKLDQIEHKASEANELLKQQNAEIKLLSKLLKETSNGHS